MPSGLQMWLSLAIVRSLYGWKIQYERGTLPGDATDSALFLQPKYM